MKHKLISGILCLLLLTVLVLPASAAWHYVRDDAQLLTQADESVIQQNSQSLHDTYGMDVVILTVDSLAGKTAMAYADDYYDEYGFLEDGILFLLSMGEREWYISTAGDARYALTDYALREIEDTVVPHLSDGMYYEAFATFQQMLPEYFDAYRSGAPIDGYYDSYGAHRVEQEPDPGVNLFLSLVIGAAAAGISIWVMRSSMNTKRPQRSASSYQKEGSYHLQQHQDLFLYSNISKRPRPQNTSGQGGGSSLHRSSSGRSHGGRGGKF